MPTFSPHSTFGRVRAIFQRTPVDIPTTTLVDEAPEQAVARRQLLAYSRASESTGRHVYGGTVPPAVVARRRAANKAARKARRAGR